MQAKKLHDEYVQMGKNIVQHRKDIVARMDSQDTYFDMEKKECVRVG